MMNDYTLRRRDRAVTDRSELFDIVGQCRVCRLGMVDDRGLPYIVPLNFGFESAGDSLILYFHSARTGRKMDILTRNPSVCFEMDVEGGVVEGKTACMHGFAYACVMGGGTVEWIEDDEQKRHALTLLMKHYTGRTDAELTHEGMNAVAVYRVVATGLSGKLRKR